MLLVLPKPNPALDTEAERKFLSLDEAGYKSLCFACHGAEGRGALAPLLAGLADSDSLCVPCEPRAVRTAL